MATLFRYLMAYAVQLAWQRAGKGGATPPVRMPFGKNKGKSLPMPMLGPWQMMILMWLGRQIWAIYGNQVKSKLRDINHPVTKHIGQILPDTGTAPQPGTPNAASQAGSPPAPQASSAGSAPPARPAAHYGTQVLDPNSNGSGNLPPGSVLNSMRGTG